MLEHLAAGGATAREKDGEDRIGCRLKSRFQIAERRLNCELN
jgi:hypothetical protein